MAQTPEIKCYKKKHVNVNHIIAAEAYVPIITKDSKEMDNMDTFWARPSETIEKKRYRKRQISIYD